MRLKIEYVDPNELVPYSGNAKLHPAEQIEQIKESINEFGFNDPIAIWQGNEIIEGHGRLIAALELGLKKVPVVRLDSLTDEQRRAYTLVHNKLTMNSGFDVDLLANELQDLPELDMSKFGFDADAFEDVDADALGWYGDERERTNRAYNLDLIDSTELTNDFWQMPVIYNQDHIPNELVGFNYAKTYADKSVGIHFYIDDYQFERVWNYPEKYVNMLMAYDCVLSPDFSLYSDMPMPMKIWNVYRSRQIGAYLQSSGVTVIPTISWAEPETYNFCFAGVPKGSVVSVSTVGVRRRPENVEMWKDGMNAMLDVIEPSAILLYGGEIEFDYRGVAVRHYENRVTEEWQNGR